MRIRALRRIVQLLFLAAFLWLLSATHWKPGVEPAKPWFLRLDPLAMVVTAVSPARRFLPFFLPALALLLLTVLFGRFFCGWVCPLGTVIDICDVVVWRRRSRRPDANMPWLKFLVLAAVVVAAVFGSQIAWLADPIPLLTRTTATVFFPIGQEIYNWAVTVGRPLLRAVHVRAYPQPVHTYAMNVALAAWFGSILALGYFSRRYWCRSLCPLGALLGLLARWGIWRRQVEGCLECKRCVEECKMGAIPEAEPSRTLTAECTLCYDCLVCPRPEISSIRLTASMAGHVHTTGTTRREFIAAAGLGLAYGAVAATSVARRPLNDRLIRPPGAIKRLPDGTIRLLSEEEFRAACIRCGNCMKVCVTGGLQPAVVEAGWDGFYTPILVPTIGWCEQNCNACGDVCPSGALQPFAPEEKMKAPIGRAHVDRSQCLSWRLGRLYKLCLVCVEHCPYGAIDVLVDQGQKRPIVNEEKCVGCGLCENKCPVTPEKAIKVQRKGPQR